MHEYLLELVFIRARKRTELEPNWNGSVRFESIRTELEPPFWKRSRTEPNSNRFLKNDIEPNRTEPN